jgi:hypothetical protein
VLAWALRSHMALARVGCLAMCRVRVERNKSGVDIVPGFSRLWEDELCRSRTRSSGITPTNQIGRNRNSHVIIPPSFRPKMCDSKGNKRGAYKDKRIQVNELGLQRIESSGTRSQNGPLFWCHLLPNAKDFLRISHHPL